jgi:hypothetical protein
MFLFSGNGINHFDTNTHIATTDRLGMHIHMYMLTCIHAYIPSLHYLQVKNSQNKCTYVARLDLEEFWAGSMQVQDLVQELDKS